MMRVFGKQIQHAFIVTALSHEIVYHQQTPFGGFEPFVEVGWIGYAFIKLNLVFGLHAIEPRLPSIIAIHNLFRRHLKEGLFPQ